MSVRVRWICDQCGNVREKELDGPSPLITPPGWSSKWNVGLWRHTCAACSGVETLPGFGDDDDPQASAAPAQRVEDGT